MPESSTSQKAKPMSKRNKRQQRSVHVPVRHRRKAVIGIGVGLLLICAIGTLAHWNRNRTTTGLAALSPAAAVIYSRGGPSKEYIYAGDKLVATVEPTPGTCCRDSKGGWIPGCYCATGESSAPAVSIGVPSHHEVFNVGSDILIRAYASDDAGIKKVEFFAGMTKLGEATTAPYDFTWRNVSSGVYAVQAKATDVEDATTLSEPVNITVNAPRDLLAHWRFDDGGGSSASDSSGYNNVGTMYGSLRGEGRVGSALAFDGIDDLVTIAGNASLTDVRDTFTVAFWAYPLSAHEIDVEHTSGWGGVSGQRYAFEPRYVPGSAAGAGISVGANGVSVYEHAHAYMPALLVHHTPLTGWTHVAVAYENKQPRLYINGTLVKTGLTSPRSSVHLFPQHVGGMAYGYYHGGLDDVRIYNRALKESEIRSLIPSAPSTLLADDFNDNARDAATWSISNAPSPVAVREQNQRLEVTPANTGNAYSGYGAVSSVDLTNGRATVEVLRTTANVMYADTLFALWGGGGGLAFLYEGGNLFFQLHQGGAVSQTYTAYHAVEHRFWRFRHDGATDAVWWQTSPNGVVWTTRRILARPWSLTSEYVHLYAGTWASYSGAGTAIYDNLKVERNP